MITVTWMCESAVAAVAASGLENLPCGALGIEQHEKAFKASRSRRINYLGFRTSVLSITKTSLWPTLWSRQQKVKESNKDNVQSE
jgi:hypothetical protein